MKSILSRVFPCKIQAHGKRVWDMINRSAKLRGGDWADPHTFRCLSCGTEWDSNDFSMNNPITVCCSNCYGEDVAIVSIKVERVNWEAINREAAEVVETSGATR